MRKKLKQLLTKARKEGKIIPFDTFIPTTNKDKLISIDIGYGITYKYNVLARFLPEFIESYEVDILKSSDIFKSASSGSRIKQIMELQSRDIIQEKMIDLIMTKGNQIVQKHFAPKKVKLSLQALEQHDDFFKKYNVVRDALFAIQLGDDIRNLGKIERRLYSEEAIKIFQSSRYDPNLFIEYIKTIPGFDDLYITTGLNFYRIEFLISDIPDESNYIEVLKILKSKPRDMGIPSITRSIYLYREYYQYYFKYKLQKMKDYKLKAVNELVRTNTYIGGIDEIVKIYTSFFRLIEKSSIRPYDTQKYLDYLCNKFPQNN